MNRERGTSLARHIFVRVAFPVGILFLGCFTVLDRVVQEQLRAHIRGELAAWDREAARLRQDADQRLGRAMAALVEGTAVGGPSEAQLTKLAAIFELDLVGAAGADGRMLSLIRQRGGHFQHRESDRAGIQRQQVVEVSGAYFLVRHQPLTKNGGTVGWIAGGRYWNRDLPTSEAAYLISNQGKIIDVAGGATKSELARGTELPVCGGAAICEVETDGRRSVLVRSALPGTTENAAIYMARTADVQASPLLGVMRNILLAGTFLSLVGALGLAVLTGRAISVPLQNITDSCERAEDSGSLVDIRVPPSRIAEINALGKTLQAAARSVEEGQTKLSQAYFQFMGAIVALLDARDPYTAGHSHRVAAYSEALARSFGLPQQQVDDIRVGALLHDIGKIGVPDEVLRKHDRLTAEEFALMKQHPTIGRKVLEQVVQFEKYLDAVELHHENLDGSGYPRGLRGEQIPIAARIVKVADVYDALSTDRPYRPRMSEEQVHQILREGAGAQFDRLLVEVFLTRCVPSFGQRSSLEQLLDAVGRSRPIGLAKKAASA